MKNCHRGLGHGRNFNRGRNGRLNNGNTKRQPWNENNRNWKNSYNPGSRTGQEENGYNSFSNFQQGNQSGNTNRPRGFLAKLKSYMSDMSTKQSDTTWLDCGANDHFFWDRSVFNSYKEI